MAIKNIFNDVVEFNIQNLNHAIKKYLIHYSFNNIDLLLSKRKLISLKIGDLYEKIIVQKRGGFCFEHNELFFYFLKEKGVEVDKSLSRVIYGQNIDVPKTHHLNILGLKGQRYLVDVGFGAYTPNSLIPMDGTIVKCPNGRNYKIKKNNDNTYSLSVLRKNSFFDLYTFDLKTYSDSDFRLSCYYSNTHPHSKHTNNFVASINNENQTKAILNRSFFIFEAEKKREMIISSTPELQKLLKREFMIEVSLSDANFLFENFK